MLLIYMILITILSLYIGFMIARMLGRRQQKYVGNIVVNKNTDGITMYSLELDSDPEIIDSSKEVIFKVVFPDVESDGFEVTRSS